MDSGDGAAIARHYGSLDTLKKEFREVAKGVSDPRYLKVSVAEAEVSEEGETVPSETRNPLSAAELAEIEPPVDGSTALERRRSPVAASHAGELDEVSYSADSRDSRGLLDRPPHSWGSIRHDRDQHLGNHSDRSYRVRDPAVLAGISRGGFLNQHSADFIGDFRPRAVRTRVEVANARMPLSVI